MREDDSMEYIMPNRMDRIYMRYQDELEEAALRVLRSGRYILGHEVSEFENEFAQYVGTTYCAGVASGLDALWMAFRVLGIGQGDEVIVQANTYIASVMGITINGATPVFVEPDEFYGPNVSEIEKRITNRTKAVLVVHLYGNSACMDKIVDLCHQYGLKLVEDCAQSHGALFGNRMTGSFGDIGCFSFYPSKNLGAYGDGGAMVTNDPKLNDEIRILRNYGSEKRYYNKIVGTNSRLDELQAGLLRVKLTHLDELNSEKHRIAEQYDLLINNKQVLKPSIRPNTNHIWHQYVVRCERRDELQNYLEANRIGTIIHYPIPPHLSEAYGYLGYSKGSYPIAEKYADTVLSIPMYNGMTQKEIQYVVDAINHFT